MPYENGSGENDRAAEARYTNPANRQRFGYARDHGLDYNEAGRYVENLWNATFPHNWAEETDNHPDSDLYECRCGDCEACGYSDDEENFDNIDERPISSDLRSLITFLPLDRILRRGGRYFSCEVEVNGISVYGAARAIGCDEGSYSARTRENGQIVATDDCTCSAEIKIGRMRDGAKMTQAARDTYASLAAAGAGCGYNTGHHVHVDATRICDLGTDAVDEVLTASLTLASALDPTLRALAASGYPEHREQATGEGYAGSLKDSIDRAKNHRTAWHASNARYHSEHGPGNGGIPTFEYRLPNGTIEPIRAHAHVAVALGLLDFGERVMDGDPDAKDFYRQARDRVAHAGDWSQADGAAILTRALHLHPNSAKCLEIAAATSPIDQQATRVFALGL